MKISCVIGLAYGDESKGLTVAHLCKDYERTLVVRFSSGQQCGHTVVQDGYRHVFSSLGSGSLSGADTYISQYCTIYPKSLFNEYKSLKEYGKEPHVFINPLAMVTTPFDIDHNRSTETVNRHGSVGMGFGATVARNENTPYKLYAIDLTYGEILVHKLKNIAAYYKAEDVDSQIEVFLEYVDGLLPFIKFKDISEICDDYEHIVFEGHQGIMLDMDFGYFPNVTRSNTTSKYAMQIVKDNNLPKPSIYYAVRSYLTRHGNGYMPNENSRLSFEDETNLTHKYQGNFRQGYHSIEQLNYALRCDAAFSMGCSRNLLISCLDQTKGMVLCENLQVKVEHFIDLLPTFDSVLVNTSPNVETIRPLHSYLYNQTILEKQLTT